MQISSHIICLANTQISNVENVNFWRAFHYQLTENVYYPLARTRVCVYIKCYRALNGLEKSVQRARNTQTDRNLTALWLTHAHSVVLSFHSISNCSRLESTTHKDVETFENFALLKYVVSTLRVYTNATIWLHIQCMLICVVQTFHTHTETQINSAYVKREEMALQLKHHSFILSNTQSSAKNHFTFSTMNRLFELMRMDRIIIDYWKSYQSYNMRNSRGPWNWRLWWQWHVSTVHSNQKYCNYMHVKNTWQRMKMPSCLTYTQVRLQLHFEPFKSIQNLKFFGLSGKIVSPWLSTNFSSLHLTLKTAAFDVHRNHYLGSHQRMEKNYECKAEQRKPKVSQKWWHWNMPCEIFCDLQ